MGGRGGGSPASRQAQPSSVPRPLTVDDVAWLIGQAHRSIINGTRGMDQSDFVSLTQIRAIVPDSPFFDEAIRKINSMKGNTLMPQSNQKILTDRDRASMVRIGNENRLLLVMRNLPTRPR